MYKAVIYAVMITVAHCLYGQKENLSKTSAGFPVNYEEALVGTYILPDPLTTLNGRKVKNTKTWEEKRRPELLKLFETYQYGKMPAKPVNLTFDVFDKGSKVLNGKAMRKQVRVYFSKDTSGPKMDLLIYLPEASKTPVPLFFTISFSANSVMVDDPGIKPVEIWTREGKKVPASKGRNMGKLDIDKFISQGIGIATVYYGDIEPDFKKGIKYGIRGYYLKPGQSEPDPDEWGAISAWAWGLSRAMDYFETDPQIDSKRIALQGTSRLGKTVLWTGAHDPRYKMVIASCSGEGGAALSRRNYGENIKHITDTSRYFYQFAANYHGFANKVNELPIDAHMLIALMAPRPLLLQTGNTDYWSDPKGEFLAALAAEPVYKLYNKKGPAINAMPEADDTTMLNTLGYYMHNGGHGVIAPDLDIFITFIKKHL